ncbi:MAG: hypothetical protein WC608_01840 [Parcubacteria group bacterium]
MDKKIKIGIAIGIILLGAIVIGGVYWQKNKNDYHSVIVHIKVDLQKDPDAITKNVDEILRGMDNADYKNLKRFTYTPYFAIAVNEKGLKYLKNHPLITGIEEDKPVSPNSISAPN